MPPAESDQSRQAGESGQPYNPVFERLVESQEDLVGLVAYSLYKASKRDWIKRRLEGGRPPSGDEMQHYAERFPDDDYRRFRDDAERMMLEFAEVIIDDRRQSIEEELRRVEFGALSTRLDRLNGTISVDVAKAVTEITKHVNFRTSMWGSVLSNVVAWAVTLALTVIALAFFLLPNLAEKVVKGVMEGRQSSGTP